MMNNVTVKAIPVRRIIRLGKTSSRLCHLDQAQISFQELSIFDNELARIGYRIWNDNNLGIGNHLSIRMIDGNLKCHQCERVCV